MKSAINKKTMNKPCRWEHGSEFHYVNNISARNQSTDHPWSASGILFGSGRDAIRALLRHGVAVYNWKKVLIPSYLCQEVVSAMSDEGLITLVYYDDPRKPIHPPIPQRGEVVFVVNTFGQRAQWVHPAPKNGFLIEDHTHDPWSPWAKESQADFCIASLRKTLPIPDGAALWSPGQLSLPPSPKLTLEHEIAAARKLEAMIVKNFFLKGYKVDKETFISLFQLGEAYISKREISGINPVSKALMNCVDVVDWRERRRINFGVLADRLSAHQELAVLLPRNRSFCPFSVIVLFKDWSSRELLRNCLAEQQIYTAILWPLERHDVRLPEDSVDISRRLLSIHCDGRYSKEDMIRVANIFKACLPDKGHVSINNEEKIEHPSSSTTNKER